MPTLNWIGKDAVINHHLEVPFRLLKDVPELGCGDPGSGNLIVEGDNLVALKALLPCSKGKVKCICIDPPYNTGNEGWAYNDNVNSPAIKKWLGETVGKEGETLDRHDRWLCMMYPRLALLREFLSEDGSIWVSMDDNLQRHPEGQERGRRQCADGRDAGPSARARRPEGLSMPLAAALAKPAWSARASPSNKRLTPSAPDED